MEIKSGNNYGRAWRDSRWLVFVEFGLVAGVYVARQHHILKVSATPYLLLIASIPACRSVPRFLGMAWQIVTTYSSVMWTIGS